MKKKTGNKKHLDAESWAAAEACKYLPLLK
jgi:hypothetical protein